MKAGKEHVVPLCDRAVEILTKLRKDCHGVTIFGNGKPLSNMAMSELLKGAAGNGYTVHGFRSSFRDWAGDATHYPRDVIEMALAHVVENKTEAAYRRGNALDKRRALMSDGALIVPLRSRLEVRLWTKPSASGPGEWLRERKGFAKAGESSLGLGPPLQRSRSVTNK